MVHRIQDRYEFDHYLVPVVIRDDRFRVSAGRPWLTVIIDKYSRMVVGYFLTTRAPSSNSVMRALKMALLPKERHLAKFPTVANEWPCWGVMVILVPDNGMEFHSVATLRACMAALTMTLEYTAAEDPQAKGTVERFFWTAQTQCFSTLPGYTGTGPDDRGEANPAAEARITLAELEQYFVKWLVDVYHCQPHAALAAPPLETWRESAKSSVLRLPPSLDTLRRALCITRRMSLTERGIVWNGLLWTSHELTMLRGEAPRAGGASPEVIVKIDPEDLGAVEVAPVGSSSWLMVPNAYPSTSGRSLEEHERVLAFARATKRGTDPKKLEEAKADLAELAIKYGSKMRVGKNARIDRDFRKQIESFREMLVSHDPAAANYSDDEVFKAGIKFVNDNAKTTLEQYDVSTGLFEEAA